MKNNKKALLTAVVTASAIITMSFPALASPYHHGSYTSSDSSDSYICDICDEEHTYHDGHGRGQGGHGCGRGTGGMRYQDGSCYTQ